MKVNPTDYATQNAILVAELIAKGAYLRTESRGGHYRVDFPQQEPTWRQRIIFQQGQPPTFTDLEMTDLGIRALRVTSQFRLGKRRLVG